MFSREWQEEVANKEKCEMYEKKVEDIIGREDYERVRKFTGRYKLFPKRDVVLAYLKFHFSKEK